MKYAYYREIHSEDLTNIPYLYWWRSSVILRSKNVGHDLVCIGNGSATIKVALMAILALVLSPILLLFSPLFSYLDMNALRRNSGCDIYYENIELYYVPSNYITRSNYEVCY